jgi:hypothetical protein
MTEALKGSGSATKPFARPVNFHNTKGHYAGLELKPFSARAGASDANKIPSRFNDVLKYRDGSEIKKEIK